MKITVHEGRPILDLEDPELRLTEAQRQAMVLDREILLTAGAGAGKTHTLSLRYVALLLEVAWAGENDVERVLVLTFTDKAAEEMAERCRERLSDLLQAARAVQADLDETHPHDSPGQRFVAALQGMVDRFDRARISTFHGFCASILREFPAETETAPGCAVLEPAEARRMRARCLEQALATLLEDRPEDLPPLLDTFGSRRSLLDAGHRALDHRGVIAPALRAHASGGVTLDAAMADAPLTPADARAWLERIGIRTLSALERLTAPSGGGPARPAVPDPPPSDATDLEIFAAYRTVLASLITETGTLRRLDHHTVMGKRATWPGDRRYRLAKEALGVLAGRIDDWAERAQISRRLPTPADGALLDALQPFCVWVLDAADLLDDALDAAGAISFDAMQLRAVRAVLGTERLRVELRRRFRYLMVDEFQDTDAVQWSLVHALARAEPDQAEDRLFLVGDLKQAIYGFRGGDVTMFRTAAETLGATPLLLPENFRSRTELIEWFNTLFPHVLGDGTARWEAPYAPLRAGRGQSGGTITLVTGTEEAHGPRWQAEATVRWIAAQLPTAAWRDDATPPVAILLRSRAHQDAYEAALRRHAVPFVVARGVGFWTRPEVIDLVNALSAVVHADPASIAAALRSPWLGLLDQDLADLHAGRWQGGGLHHFGRDPISRDAPEAVREAHARFRRWNDLRHALPASEWLAAVVRELAPTLASLDDGQAAANAARVVEMAAGWDADGVEAIADRLLWEVQAGARASEAVVLPSAARVVLCTIHASKGLEFPVVVVPELDRRSRGRAATLLIRRPEGSAEWQLAARVLDPDADVQTRVQPGRYASLDHVRRQEEDAEERRLLYVAVTRARDHLVLVGNAATTASPGARTTWIQQIEHHLPRGTQRIAATALMNADVPSPRPPAAPPPPDDAAADRIAPVVVRRHLALPASALDLFATCPARWYRRDLLGIPEAPATAVDRAMGLAAARGQVLHQVLEDALEHDDASVALRWRTQAALQGATPAEVARGLRMLTAHLSVTCADPHVRTVIDATGHTELPFRAAHAGVVLEGRIDRLWRDDDGWVVLDWKSEAMAGRQPEQVAARHERQLLAYAWAADRVLAARGQGRVVRGEVYLTAIGRAVSLGAWTPEDLAQVPSSMEQVAQVAGRRWSDVEALAVDGPTQRPCDQCHFRGRGCRGQRSASVQ